MRSVKFCETEWNLALINFADFCKLMMEGGILPRVYKRTVYL